MAKPSGNGVSQEVIDQLILEYGDSSPFWLKTLKTIEPTHFGIQKVSGKLVPKLRNIIRDAKKLYDLGIIMPKVFGGGPQITQLYKDEGYGDLLTYNGLRPTPEPLIGPLCDLAEKNLEEIADQFTEAEIPVRTFFDDVFRVKRHPIETHPLTREGVDLGYVGDVVEVNWKPIEDAIRDGKTPLISHIGRDIYGVPHNINATVAGAELWVASQGYKYLITGNVCVQDNGERVKRIRSEERVGELFPGDYPGEDPSNPLIKDPWKVTGMELNLRTIFGALPHVRPGGVAHLTVDNCTVSEFLTNGEGTIIRKPFEFYSTDSYDYLATKLRKLIDLAFASDDPNVVSKKLVDDYFVRNRPKQIYLDDKIDPTGGMIMGEVEGLPYACKIFTHPDYQGAGLARQVIEHAVAKNHSLVWRADKRNKDVVDFYKDVVDSWNYDKKTPENTVSYYKESGGYYVFGMNVEMNRWNRQLWDKVASLPATMVPLK